MCAKIFGANQFFDGIVKNPPKNILRGIQKNDAYP